MMPQLGAGPAPLAASSPVSPEHAATLFLNRLKTPCRLLVAYSGGGDSTGLLVALTEALRADPGLDISLVAATVDHGLRPGSTEEAHSVGALCRRLYLPHHILTWRGTKPSSGIQAAAREARYRLLGECAKTIKADLIVTAHNCEDQAETIAMRIARNPDAADGMSEAVLCGRQTWVYRPFLNVGRGDIRNYLRSRSTVWVDDPSNDSPAFERVRVRKTAPSGATIDLSQRRRLAGETAHYLLGNVVVYPAGVAVVDLSTYAPSNPAHLQAIRHLAALMGGRTFLAGGDTTARIAGFLAQTEERRQTAERVVFDRRKSLLYIGREKRSLPTLEIGPGDTEIWDNRFRVSNHGDATSVIAPHGVGQAGDNLLAGSLPDDLPGAVRQRAVATSPVALQGDRGSLTIQPIIAQFDRFLPLDVVEIGNALAFLCGMDHFPDLPTR